MTSEFQVQAFDARRHYEMVAGWWQAHRWSAIPLDALPANGFLVSDEKEDHCAGFLYLTDSTFGWFEFLVGNPHSSARKRAQALDVLIQAALGRARELGCRVVFSSLQHRGLIKKYEKNGFLVTDQGMTNLIWRG